MADGFSLDTTICVLKRRLIKLTRACIDGLAEAEAEALLDGYWPMKNCMAHVTKRSCAVGAVGAVTLKICDVATQ